MAEKGTTRKKSAPKKTRKKSPSRPSTKDKPLPPDNSGPVWLAVSTRGRKPIFPDPETLWNACLEYFAWVQSNPLYEQRVFCNQGEITRADVPKMRIMTLAGMRLFLDIDRHTWDDYAKRTPEFTAVCTRAEDIIYQQKLSGAAADLLNANIIARELGLVDKQEREHKGGVKVTTNVPE